MVTISVAYEDDLHCRATHEPSGSTLTTDAPADNRGRGEDFSPTDLLATSVATCIVTVMGIAAADHGWEMGGTTARVEKHMVADPKRRIGRLEVDVHVAGDFGPEERAVLEAAAHGCPVCASLSPAVETNLRFHWGGEG